ncbi:MAG: two component transcriptional regulator, LuxR family [Verrucomicrobia bacterium]|nr:two component transcriptional regulator, LuxR family [Verrucomicrobiota bacterium]
MAKQTHSRCWNVADEFGISFLPVLHIARLMKIVIVEDHLMFREVLRKVCTRDLRHTVVGEASDGRTAVELVIKTMPDLVLLDLHLPNLDGFGVVEALKQAAPLVRILVLSSHCDLYTVFRAEKGRVHGFVDKNTNTVATLKDAITAVSQGRTYFSESFVRIKDQRHRDPQSFDKLLTDRERAILTLIGLPLTDLEIAVRLEISTETVSKHRFNVLRKLGLQTTSELMRYSREHGFTLSAQASDPDALLP